MLAAYEFTIGALADAAPLSLILPRNKYEATVLIGRYNDVPAAVFLEGEYAYHYFESADNTSWRGLIIPNVRVEVDETSVSDGGALGSLVRKSTTLGVRVKRDRSFDDGATVTLHDELADAGDQRAGFQNWQIVIGIDANKRVLWKTPK
ncbi:hypothetical protein [Agrobacterium tumefaciens]|uniref:Uncharacterized protein n=1 Tax=Agrobacterium tumefaciens TaxID=358 RepID=A0AA44JAL5_AGRTU|nr:hypothetical protein [Agrobacterium tumefaciens]NSL25111.1 hypothetical protein [Agrobacterium tumefaciens]NTB86764.1 hypothetical protein [Agrobacterium tumefaciens]NTC21093.1 hypothetical protein [Agrobacterium tumefaciens]NTC30641.1 hypothetical protein [Agrobacterium tumefaciens]NTC57697.1 hypothetical protein [Agrobacterium tumefaciens]